MDTVPLYDPWLSRTIAPKSLALKNASTNAPDWTIEDPPDPGVDSTLKVHVPFTGPSGSGERKREFAYLGPLVPATRLEPWWLAVRGGVVAVVPRLPAGGGELMLPVGLDDVEAEPQYVGGAFLPDPSGAAPSLVLTRRRSAKK
jgi:hypothetical protein